MLKDALALRERLERRSGAAYAVRRSGRRSLAVSPFYVMRARRRRR